jgi:1-acyl-sn-glycerol-3-phosphate acyltransferase
MSEHANSEEMKAEDQAEKKPRVKTRKKPAPSRPIPVGNALVYGFTRLVVLAHFRLGGGRVYGQKNIPRQGRFILAANHVSYLDPPLVSSLSPRRPHTIAKKELFEHPLIARFFRALGAFPIDRGKADRKAIRHAIEMLESEAPLLIFPEGGRSRTGELGAGGLGLGMIAHATKSPIIPVYLRGADQAVSPMNPKLGIVKIEVHYGEPLDLSAEYSRRGDRATIDAIGEKTMAAIAALRDGSEK